jgi:hypothetical protein
LEVVVTLQVAGKWLGFIMMGSTVVAGAIASLTYVFATKNEVLQLERVQVEATADTKLRDFRIQRLEVQVQNVENIAQRTDKNVEKLLILRHLEPGPKPNVKPLPSLPSPDSLRDME